MKAMYAAANISKQGHAQAIQRETELESRIPAYVGFIEQIREFHPGMGLRAIYEQFEPEGIGRDAFIALGLQEGFRLKTYQSPVITTRRKPGRHFSNLLVDVELTDVNQVWVSDITYYRLGEEFWYLSFIMDVYSRRIIGFAAAGNMRAENNIAALNMALSTRGKDKYKEALIHHSDRGSQYTSEDYTELLKDNQIRISMCMSALENAHCERINGTIKNDYLQRWEVKTPGQLKKRLPQAVKNYNEKQHGSLGKKTPKEFELYIQQIPKELRPKMEIFTYEQNEQNPNQLHLFKG